MAKNRQPAAHRKAAGRRAHGAVKADCQAIDYRNYTFSIKEHGKLLAEYFVLSSGFAFLFYKSWQVAVALWLFYPVYLKKKRKEQIAKRQQALNLEFKDSIHCVANSLAVGYSIENAFRKAHTEMCLQNGAESLMAKELQYFNSCLSLNVPLENLLGDFAFRSGLEDVQSFCEVFNFAKRSGGDFIQIIHLTVNRISEKTELSEAIQTEITGKRMEQKVMNIMPLMILLYVDLSFGGYLDVLYHNAMGIAVMSICLVVYLAAYLLSEKVMDIHI